MVIENYEAYQLIEGEVIRIRDKLIKSIDILIGESSKVEIRFSDIHSKEQDIVITLTGIMEVNYYFQIDGFTYLEDFKISYEPVREEYYFSIDPDNSISERSENDCSFFIGKNLKVILKNT